MWCVRSVEVVVNSNAFPMTTSIPAIWQASSYRVAIANAKLRFGSAWPTRNRMEARSPFPWVSALTSSRGFRTRFSSGARPRCNKAVLSGRDHDKFPNRAFADGNAHWRPTVRDPGTRHPPGSNLPSLRRARPGENGAFHKP